MHKLLPVIRPPYFISASDEDTVIVVMACGVGCYHAMYLMMFIGSRARMETTMVYLVIDTFLIFLLFYKTVSKVNDFASSDGVSFCSFHFQA